LSHNRIELFVPLTADVDSLPSGVTGLTPTFGSAPNPAMNSKQLVDRFTGEARTIVAQMKQRGREIAPVAKARVSYALRIAAKQITHARMTGLAIGFGLGVVFAPMSGVEVRSTIVEKTNEAVDSGRSMAQRVKSAAGEIGKLNPESRGVEA
jgi:hypothetical protein